VQLAAFIVSIFALVNIPLINRPLPGYEFGADDRSSAGNLHSFKVNVFNYGVMPAEKVIVSVHSNDNKVNFTKLSTIPFLENHVTTTNTTKYGNKEGFIEVDSVPPFSGLTVIVQSNTSDATSDPTYTVYVTSKAAIGYSKTDIVTSLVIIFIIAGVLSALIYDIRRR
jgi:hypothetical protein